MLKITLVIASLLCFVAMSCNEDASIHPETATWYPNPNGDSDLALLMREMYDDGILVKHQILNGQKPDVNIDLSNMYTSNATEPEKVASPEYAAFAASYESALEALKSAKKSNASEAYETMVNACMACHQALCPGPKQRIKKMFYSKKQKELL